MSVDPVDSPSDPSRRFELVDFKARALEGFPEFSTNFPLKIAGFSWLGDSFPSFGEAAFSEVFFNFRGRYTYKYIDTSKN